MKEIQNGDLFSAFGLVFEVKPCEWPGFIYAEEVKGINVSFIRLDKSKAEKLNWLDKFNTRFTAGQIAYLKRIIKLTNDPMKAVDDLLVGTEVGLEPTDDEESY